MKGIDTMTNKMTYVEALTIAINTLSATGDNEAVERLTALKEQTEKRNTSRSDKPTKTQTENIAVKDVILTTLEFLGKAVTITELQDGNEELSGLSNQKVSALVRQLVEEGKVTKTTEKRKSYFTLAVAQ